MLGRMNLRATRREGRAERFTHPDGLTGNLLSILFGLALAGATWFALSAVIASDLLVPPPQKVLPRIESNFLSAPGLTNYGLPDNLWRNLVYTVENVLVSMGIGTA